MKLFNKQSQKGFTIIEVMIVLAIAGVIIAAVLIAVPQLQRNQRNTSRKAVVGRVKTEVDNYVGNNNGSAPVSAAALASLATRYLTGVDIKDPKTGSDMTLVYETTAGNYTAGLPFKGVEAQISYKDGEICDGENAAAGSGRQYAVWTILEGGAVYCLDNK
jgi:prepilin-type N-terminal cleavage/methylation domain-containing protein